MPKTIPAGEFKAKCLKLMDQVAKTGEPLIITKRGKGVAELIPFRTAPEPFVGRMKGSITYMGDVLSPIDVDWYAESD